MPKFRKKRLTELKAKQVDRGKTVIESMAHVSLGERLVWMAGQPMEPGKPQQSVNIGFWNPMRYQMDLF